MTQPKLNIKTEIIKAYDYAVENSLISKIHGIKKVLFFQKIKIYFSRYIYSTNSENVEYLLSQTLNLYILSLDFNKKILLSVYNKNIFSHPLPEIYIDILKLNSIKISRIKSRIKYIYMALKYLISGLLNNLRLLKNVIFVKKPLLSINKYVLFPDLSENCIPIINGNNYNIIHWYLSNNTVSKLKEIRHNKLLIDFIIENVHIKSEEHYYDYIKSFDKKLKFIIWTFSAILYNIFCFLTFRYSNLFLYSEACKAKVYDLIDKKYLPFEVLYSVSTFSLKPLWTYVVEEKGTRVVNYSYASSFQGFKTGNEYIDQEYFFENTKWKHIFLWSKYYFNYVNSRVPNNVTVYCLNPIYYSDSNFTLEKNNYYIGVFDVTPHESDISCTYLPESRYRNTQNSIKFLNDIHEIAILNNYVLLWKRKRRFSATHSKEYIKFSLEFEKRRNVIVVDADVSAFKIIQLCKICISMPFTSTALIAKHYNIKSIYYDPTGELFNDDRGAQGIELIKNKKNLLNYIKNV